MTSTPPPSSESASGPAATTPGQDAEKIKIEQGTVQRLADGRSLALVTATRSRASVALSGGDDSWNGTLSLTAGETVSRGTTRIRCESSWPASGGKRSGLMATVWTVSG